MTAVAPAQTYKTIFRFRNVNTGLHPTAGLIQDAQGSFYGTTFDGGQIGGDPGFGTVFKLDSAGQETVLYRFTGYFDGLRPIGRLLGFGNNLIGATSYSYIEDGTGSIYQLTLDGTETELARFGDDTFPTSGLIRDGNGNMYGTLDGGNNTGGSVYEFPRGGGFVLLHTFGFHQAGSGLRPRGQLALDDNGNLYGVTEFGGGVSNQGVVFKLTPSGQETGLHRFAGKPDGGRPRGGLVRYAGNFYGTTSTGGSANAGTIFAIDPTGNYSLLYSFTGGADGADPESELIVDGAGNILGTARRGGANNLGTVFELRTDGQLYVLHTFQGGMDGARPEGGLFRDGAGNLYGTTRNGGGARDGGTVFQITPQ